MQTLFSECNLKKHTFKFSTLFLHHTQYLKHFGDTHCFHRSFPHHWNLTKPETSPLFSLSTPDMFLQSQQPHSSLQFCISLVASVIHTVSSCICNGQNVFIPDQLYLSTRKNKFATWRVSVHPPTGDNGTHRAACKHCP